VFGAWLLVFCPRVNEMEAGAQRRMERRKAVPPLSNSFTAAPLNVASATAQPIRSPGKGVPPHASVPLLLRSQDCLNCERLVPTSF